MRSISDLTIISYDDLTIMDHFSNDVHCTLCTVHISISFANIFTVVEFTFAILHIAHNNILAAIAVKAFRAHSSLVNFFSSLSHFGFGKLKMDTEK